MEYIQNIEYSGLFALYMIISVNFLTPTLPCQIQDYLRHSLIAKHIAGFLALYFFVVITIKNSKQHYGIWNVKLFQAFVLYICFIISSRCDPRFLSIFILFLALDFFIYSYYNEKHDHQDYIKSEIEDFMYELADIFGIISLAGLAIGFVLALYHKKKSVSLVHFLFGNAKC